MKARTFFAFIAGIVITSLANAAPLTGLYQTIDDKTNQPKAIVALYEYMDADDTGLAGRIVAVYRDGAVVTDSPVIDMDIIRDMKWDADDNRYEDGKITDPQTGKVYSSVIWQDVPGKLNVRGKVGPFGRTQIWNALTGDKIPSELKNLDTSNWKPKHKK
ncbi:MAG: DUF2147 domain-containing protein [Muribaculaceae bacterium]|nr:DUF2147 domain-containing protein [Muribaculaceae bacterium]